ncbi:MAG: hypothetical protein JSV93_04180, partial [Candidatus Omnitrophota bacterium]
MDNTRMIIEFIHGPGDESGVMVWARNEKIGTPGVYSYLKVDEVLIPRILKAGSHITPTSEKRGTDAFNMSDSQADLPPSIVTIWNRARDKGVRSRDLKSPVCNIAKTINGGISEFTTTLLEATIHSIFAAGMGADTIIIDKDGNFYDGKKLYEKGINVSKDIESGSLKAFQKVLFTTGDPAWMKDLRTALETAARDTERKDDNKPRNLPDPIWVPDAQLIAPSERIELTNFLKGKKLSPDLIKLVDLWTRATIDFGREYKKASTLKPMGTANIGGEAQYVADIIADEHYHQVFKDNEGLLYVSVSEERDVTRYGETAEHVSYCDPVDGVKNLLQGLTTGNIEAITFKDGSGGVSMHFLQGSNILIFEDGKGVYCAIWDGSNFQVMYEYEFGKPVSWAIKNIAVGGSEGQYGATNPDARALVDKLVAPQQGYYSDNAYGMLIDISRILERGRRRAFDRKLKPKGENLGIYDIVPRKETIIGGLLKSGGFLYLDMATARPNPEIVDLGAKMRLTELVAQCKEISRVKGLGYHFGTNKNLDRIIVAYNDANLPKLAYPCYLGVADDVLEEINSFMWPRYVEQGFASEMQAKLPFEKYDVSKDPDYKQALDIDSKGRVYRLKKNSHVGMVRFKEPEGWRSYPVHGRVEHLDVDAIFSTRPVEEKLAHQPLYLWRPLKARLETAKDREEISEEVYDRVVNQNLGIS